MVTEQTPEFAVLVLERVEAGRTQEHHAETLSFDEALSKAKEAAEMLPSWIAMTIVHATDYPRFLPDEAAGLKPALNTEIVRDVLVALCERDGLSLDSEADPGTPARNYELAIRLGIGETFIERGQEMTRSE